MESNRDKKISIQTHATIYHAVFIPETKGSTSKSWLAVNHGPLWRIISHSTSDWNHVRWWSSTRKKKDFWIQFEIFLDFESFTIPFDKIGRLRLCIRTDRFSHYFLDFFILLFSGYLKILVKYLYSSSISSGISYASFKFVLLAPEPPEPKHPIISWWLTTIIPYDASLSHLNKAIVTRDQPSKLFDEKPNRWYE